MKLVGESNRVKPIDRYKAKAADERHAKPDRTIHEILDHIPDCLRYTYCSERTDYLTMCERVCHQLAEIGNQQLVQRNWWNRPYYKGITTHWRSNDEERTLFEVQLHTIESLEARVLTDPAYARLRNSRTSPEERGKLLDFLHRVADAVPIPYGADVLPSFRHHEEDEDK